MLAKPAAQISVPPFIGPAGSREVMFVVGDAVYSAPGVGGTQEAKRVGVLSPSYGKALLARCAGELEVMPGVIAEAYRYAKHFTEFEFVVSEILPLLYELDGAPARRPALPPDLPRIVENLATQAAALNRTLARPPVPDVPPATVAQWVRAPCAIFGQVVVPLERDGTGGAGDCHVLIAGVTYRFAWHGAQALSQYLRGIEVAARAHVIRAVARNATLSQRAQKFLCAVQAALAWYHPQQCGPYTLVYKNRHYQLQHSRGCWVIVRGPVRVKNRGTAVYVGLHIKGSTRQERLAVVPRRAPTAEGFFRSDGQLSTAGGICMGCDRSQYRHLRSSVYGEGDAVLAWLEAGVNLATGRSNFHRAWRAQRAKLASAAR